MEPLDMFQRSKIDLIGSRTIANAFEDSTILTSLKRPPKDTASNSPSPRREIRKKAHEKILNFTQLKSFFLLPWDSNIHHTLLTPTY